MIISATAPHRRLVYFRALILATISACLPRVMAQTAIFWNGNAAANWSGTNKWYTNISGTGGSNASWATNNAAIFGATGSSTTVNVGTTNITSTAYIRFQVTGYTLGGSGNGTATLTFPQIAVDNTLTGTINAVVAGTNLTVNQYTQSAVTTTTTGTLILGGANTYTGTTTVAGGTLQLGANSTLPAATDVTVSSGANLDVNGKTQTVGSIIGAGTISFGGSGTLTLNQASSTTFSGTISGSGATLAKSGGGTLTLSGGSAVALGTASVSGGTLKFVTGTGAVVASATVNGSSSFLELGTASALTAGTNLTLQSNGSLSVSSAGSIGSFSFGTLLVTSNGTIDFGSSVSGATVIDFSNSTTTSGWSGTLNLLNYSYSQGDGLKIGSTANNSNVNLNLISFNGINAVWDTNNAGYIIPASAIPEPSTYAALAGLGALCLAMYHRRQAREASKLTVTASV